MSRWFTHRIRVRYQETDRMGVVYHANYLTWFEIGRTEFIREMGVPYQSIEAKGLLLPVLDVEASYKKPARYDDLLVICTRIAAFSPLRLEFESEIRRISEETDESPYPYGKGNRFLEEQEEPQGELLAKGRTRHMWLNEAWKPVKIDKEAPELYALLKQADS